MRFQLLLWCIHLLHSSTGTVKRDTTEDKFNLARGRPTAQSTTYSPGNGITPSDRAVDGNKSPKYDEQSCSSTKNEFSPWWRVDLEEQFKIKAVSITNRDDGYRDRLKKMTVAVSKEDSNGIRPEATKCATDASIPEGETKEFECPSGTIGRFVFIQLGYKQYLTLCEVEVYPVEDFGHDAKCRQMKAGGSPGTPVPDSINPPNRLISIEFWVKEPIKKGFEIFGAEVHMSQVFSGLEAKGYPITGFIADEEKYVIRIRADTFYCDKSDKYPNGYKLPAVARFDIIARNIVGMECKIEFTQPDRIDKEDRGLIGQGSKKGKKGENGKPGRNLIGFLSYMKSSGKMNLIANGGGGSDGLRGQRGGKGKPGKEGLNSTCIDSSRPNCPTTKGGQGRQGERGYQGGAGGNGGTAGNGGSWFIFTKQDISNGMQLFLKGCGGTPGKAGAPGEGGEGGDGGPSGFGCNKRIISGMCNPARARNGEPGPPGDQGDTGDKGFDGFPGQSAKYLIQPFNAKPYDDDVLELMLRKADTLFIQGKSSEALEIYECVIMFAKKDYNKKYAKVMLGLIRTQSNFFGFKTDVVEANQLNTVEAELKKIMDNAERKSQSINDFLKAESESSDRRSYFQGVRSLIKSQNDAILLELDDLIKIKRNVRRKLLQLIKDIEYRITFQIEDLKLKLHGAQKRAIFDTIFSVVKIGFALRPGGLDLEHVYTSIKGMGDQFASCSNLFELNMFKLLKGFGMDFERFKDVGFDWAKIDLSKMKDSSFVDIEKLNIKINLDSLKENLNCYIEAGTPGLLLENAIGTLMDLACSRFIHIGNLYKVDSKLTEYHIRKDKISQSTESLQGISREAFMSTSKNDVLLRLAFREEMIDRFREVEKASLSILYIYSDTLRFQTLWDFGDCMTSYSPNYLVNAEVGSSFHGYQALSDLSSKIDNYFRFFKRCVTLRGREQPLQMWTYEINERNNAEFMFNMRSTGMGKFDFDPTLLCQDKCTNVRLVKIYAEVEWKNEDDYTENALMIEIQHLGFNRFFIGKVTDPSIHITQQSLKSVLFQSRVKPRLISKCRTGDFCPNTDTFPQGVVKSLCTVPQYHSKSLKRNQLMMNTRDPCRSPFSRYTVQLPIGTQERVTSQKNPKSLKTKQIQSIRFVFGIKLWTKYPKPILTCKEFSKNPTNTCQYA